MRKLKQRSKLLTSSPAVSFIFSEKKPLKVIFQRYTYLRDSLALMILKAFMVVIKQECSHIYRMSQCFKFCKPYEAEKRTVKTFNVIISDLLGG